jgi:hypothetical protein
MQRAPVNFLLALVALAFIASAARATEPLLGTWQLEHQELNGQKKETEPITLRVSPDGDRLLFAFSVPVNNIDFVSMTYSANLDGTESEVKNARGLKVGVIRITLPSRSHYKLTLRGENRPESTGRLTVSPDGKTLTSEADSIQAGHNNHLVQTFTRE